MKTLPTSEAIEAQIVVIREQKVVVDVTLARLYGVPTRAVIQSVKRNIKRFPTDFMFQLTTREFANLRSQTVISGWGGRRYHPYVFTEQGVAMLSSVLKSERAIVVNIAIMRAFVKLREVLSTHNELALKLKQLEMMIEKHDADIQAIFDAIRHLLEPPPPTPKHPIGFQLDR